MVLEVYSVSRKKFKIVFYCAVISRSCHVSQSILILFKLIFVSCSFFCTYMMERKYTQLIGHVKITFGKV